MLAATSFLWISQNSDPHYLIQQLNQNQKQASKIIENRHGIITIFKGESNDDAVFGGNVYDGRTNLSLDKNTNGLHRPLLLATLQPQPLANGDN